jgi:hypothetical protein
MLYVLLRLPKHEMLIQIVQWSCCCSRISSRVLQVSKYRCASLYC